jgi:hypothetical protein
LSNTAIALRVLLLGGAFVAFCWVLVSLVRGSKRGGKGIQAIGAMLMMFGWGNMRDPRNDTVAEAQDGRIRKGTHSGDPLDSP